MARTGLAICYYTRGEVERGRALAAEVLAAAEARGDREQALLGHTNVGVPEHYQGKFASSLAHCERAIALYDPVQHHGHVRVLGNDQGVGALNHFRVEPLAPRPAGRGARARPRGGRPRAPAR